MCTAPSCLLYVCVFVSNSLEGATLAYNKLFAVFGRPDQAEIHLNRRDSTRYPIFFSNPLTCALGTASYVARIPVRSVSFLIRSIHPFILLEVQPQTARQRGPSRAGGHLYLRYSAELTRSISFWTTIL
jgi:hypothetical protein